LNLIGFSLVYLPPLVSLCKGAEKEISRSGAQHSVKLGWKQNKNFQVKMYEISDPIFFIVFLGVHCDIYKNSYNIS
jgi:hypothetical protein